jgi:hypothetical protein
MKKKCWYLKQVIDDRKVNFQDNLGPSDDIRHTFLVSFHSILLQALRYTFFVSVYWIFSQGSPPGTLSTKDIRPGKPQHTDDLSVVALPSDLSDLSSLLYQWGLVMDVP